MDIKLAYTFLKVSELGNITKAAEQLGYSQASVSSHIQQLEQDLGVALFDRIGRGIQLTDAGRRFRPYAVNLIKASEDADAFALDRTDPAGDLVIEASSSALIGILSRILPEFCAQYPGIHIAVRLGEDTDVLVSRVRQNRIDFAMFLDQKRNYEGCVKAAERYERFVFVAPPSDELAGKEGVNVMDIFDSFFISTFTSSDSSQQLRSVLDPFFTEHEMQPDVELGANAAAVSFMIHGGGRSFLPYFMVEEEVKRKTLSIIDTEDIDSGMYTQVIYSANRWISPQMQAFIDFCNDITHR